MEKTQGIEKIKGICKPYGTYPDKEVTYISEFESYAAGLADVKRALADGWQTDYDAFNVVLKEFERLTKGRETDIIPLYFNSVAIMAGNVGYFFSGKTSANDQIAAEMIYTSDAEITDRTCRFSVFDPKIDMRKILTDFSKDSQHKKGFHPNFRLDNVIDKYRIAKAESTLGGYRSIDWHVEGDHPLISEVYNNTLAEMATYSKK